MIEARLEALVRRHEALEDALHQEESHAYHDEARIHTIKQEKLRLKDEMRTLEQAANSNRRKWN